MITLEMMRGTNSVASAIASPTALTSTKPRSRPEAAPTSTMIAMAAETAIPYFVLKAATP